MSQANLRNYIIAAILAALFSMMIAAGLPVWAESVIDSTDNTQQLLEKSLSIVEIDKEILRIRNQKEELLQTLAGTEQEIMDQELQIADKKKQAGHVLRSYYMGDRDILLASLFSSRSLTELFRLMEYIDIIFSHDKHTLNNYMAEYRLMKDTYAELEAQRNQLAAIEDKLLEQRERVIALESSLEQELEGRTDAERIRLLITELTSHWETAGLREVRQYFQALSSAMAELPGWISDNKDLMEMKGMQYTITLPDHKLNEFLRSQDEMFNHMSFEFSEQSIQATGKRDQIEVQITGHYTVENEPVNGIIFHIDELYFNGFALPDTTLLALEEEFDLGFYPNLLVAFLKANSVDMNDGELTIKLGLKL